MPTRKTLKARGMIPRPKPQRAKTRHCEPCQKVAFPDELSAKIVLMKRSAKEKGEKRVYRCPARNGWHLTSKGDWS